MKPYQINYRKLVFLLLPTFLRQKKLTMLLTSAVQPLTGLHAQFTRVIEEKIYRINHNGQVCYLRKVLNDAFPDRNKSFQIEDVNRTGRWLYAKNPALTDQLYIPKKPNYIMVWSTSGIVGETASFLVIIPNNLQGEDLLNQIKAKVNEYKLLSKKPNYTYG